MIKVAADQFVYTPLFCIWFLAAFVVLERKNPRTIPSVIRADWLEMYRGNAGFFLPLTGLIYGYVPRDERVLAFGAGSLIYTCFLSLWNSARVGKTAELCRLEDDSDSADGECVAMPSPPRARPLLSIGVRRALVKAGRRAQNPR